MRKKLLFLSAVLISGIFLAGFFYFRNLNPVKAGVSDNVSGFAWSENIGWLSFNCTDTATCGTVNYGVNMNINNGKFSGYAWSEHLGWFSFNEADTGVPPSDDPCSDASCIAKATAPGQLGRADVLVHGWARALSYNENWDGWLRFDHGQTGEVYIDKSGEFRGWAWGGNVVGWVSFNCANPESGDVCSTSDYKVLVVGLNEPPIAAISCDPSGCNSTGCIGYTGCAFTLDNTSTDPDGQDDIVKSRWDILDWGSTPDLTCTSEPLCNFTPQGLSAGTYTGQLYIEDSAGSSSTTTKAFQIKQEAVAGFVCAVATTTPVWMACEDMQVSAEQIILLSDSRPSPLEHSTPSEGASGIIKRVWEKDGQVFSQDNDPTPSVTLTQGSRQIELTITDNVGRTDSQTHTISVRVPLPKWKEVAP